MRLNRNKQSWAAAFLLALAPLASATTWYVNGVNGSDSNNCMAPQTACKTIGHSISLASSGDSIMVAAATYNENLKVGFNLTITGSGAHATIIDGGHIDTVVTIGVAKVTISRMTIRHSSGSGGGVAVNGGTATINDSTVSGNSSGYQCASNPNSKVCTAEAVGIYNNGILAVNNTTISGNYAFLPSCPGPPPLWECEATGVGIFSWGQLTINNSTLSGNGVSSSFSCHNCFVFGGGISNSGALTINNSTLSGNGATASSYAVGGVIYNTGTLAINNTTLSGNTHGVVNSGTVILQNSIIAHTVARGNCSGTMISHGYNLSSDNTCNFSNSGDLNNIDPNLGQLGNYGGPTQTIPLSAGSPAIDAGNPSGCTDGRGHLLKTDQRGMPRPDNEDSSGCDMGAYETQSD